VGVTEPPEATNTALLLMMLGRRIREQTETALRAEGLSMRQLSVLGHLAHQPGLSYSELARRDGITVQSMQSTLLQLEKTGAVERLTAPGRGRTADLQVTAEGPESRRSATREGDRPGSDSRDRRRRSEGPAGAEGLAARPQFGAACARWRDPAPAEATLAPAGAIFVR
jgi:DNA-binding MarR family transcriptional regulator